MFNLLNPNLIIGFHGCDEDVGEDILSSNLDAVLKPSDNDYDWLGPGIYFWESDPHRALSFAQQKVGWGSIKRPFVLGAVFTLGNCVDTTTQASLDAIENAYKILEENIRQTQAVTPINGGGRERFFRRLDNAVIRTLHTLAEIEGKQIDSVRGLFHEGHLLYPDSGFSRKSHVQIAICNPDCIKGVFRWNESA